MRKMGLLILLVFALTACFAPVFAQGYQAPPGSPGTAIVPLPPSQAGRLHYNPDARVAQGNYLYGMVKVDHAFDSFYVSLSNGVKPERAIFDAIAMYGGGIVYHDELSKPPFYATWHQSMDPFYRIVAIHYALFFKNGKKVEATLPLERDYQYRFVPAP